MAAVSTTNFNALFKFKAFPLLTALFLNLFLIGCSYPTYSIKFYDDNLDLNYAASIIGEANISLPTLISDNNLSTPLYLASSSTDISTNTALEVTKNINLYAIQNVQEITTQEELAAINTNTTTLTGKYILLNNITLDENKAGFDNTTNEGWIPIGSYKPYPETLSFRGIFNGNNNTITNLWINRPTTHGVGLFGFIEYAQIRNLGVETAEGKEIKGDYYVGGIVGEIIGGYIINSYSNGNISGNSSVGGIAGAIAIGSITNSYSMGNINGNERIGGIAGDVYENSDIINSYSNGSISGNNSVGGIAGYASQSDITNSHSVGHVSGDKRVGGIVGFIMNNRDITNSYSAGNISGNRGVGGIAGDVMSNRNIANSYSTGNISGNSEVGGIAGRFGDGNITNSYSTGDISGNESIGGIAGDIATGNIANSYSTGNISGDDMVGGIAGYLYYSSAQNNAAINPSVTGTSNVNRVIGYIDTTYGPITISNNFALYTMSGGISGSFDHSNINRYGISKSDIDLKFQITYSDTVNGNGFGGLGWKFGDDDDNPWVQDAFSDYPYPTLYWQK
ncbi:MAG: hypothetical protein LBT96_02280 [Campylobacteraceae bacterium]|jgi:hypothetical protein|nr:hypothetical protein [Campylobacteraceae bacterium]